MSEIHMGEFKYDQSDIHLSYEKSRRLPAETVRLWLETISRYVPQDSIKTIIDLGCGTGRFTQALSDHFSAQVFGIDLSHKMLTTALRSISSPLTELVQGTAEGLPFYDGMADLIFLSMVYHHIQDKGKTISEFTRVLKDSGYLCTRTSTVDSLDSYPWLQFFPSARQIEVARTPSRKGITEVLQANGFELKGHSIVYQFFAENLREYFEKISLRGLSSLKAITDDEFQEGLVRLEKYCREKEKGEAVFEDIDLFIFCVA